MNEERDGSTTAEITDALSDVHERTVRRACRRHADRGLLKVRSDPEDGRRIRWEDHGLGTLRRDACAEVELPELENDGGTVADKPRMRLYTRNVRNLPEVENSPSLSPLSDAPVSATGTLDPPDPVE